MACLRDKGLQEIIKNAEAGSLIKLLEEVVWMGDKVIFTNELYVRPCYLELLEAKESYFKLNKNLSSVVFTGTPGIGKSHLCALVIAQKLIAGMTVYFESHNLDTTQFFKLELEGGVRRLESLGVLHLLQDTATAIYIVDGGPPSCPSSPLEYPVFASPSRSVFRGKKKAWPCLYLHTPLFDLEEMCECKLAVSAFKAISDASVEEWFSVAGGVARTVLKLASEGTSLEDWKAQVINNTKSLDVDVLEVMVAGLQMDTFPPGSDTLFHWSVVEKCLETNSLSPEMKALMRFKRKIVCFASDWVANIIYHKLRLDNVLKVVSFILSTIGEVETAAVRGYWFEAVCHMIISGGGEFACRWLDTEEEFKLKLPMAQSTSYKSYEEAAGKCQNDLSVYCVPLSRTQAAFDAMNSPFLLFEMASGVEHTINTKLNEFLKVMEDEGRGTHEALDFVRSVCDPQRMELNVPVLVFCTTPTHFKAGYKNDQRFGAADPSPMLQAVLEIPIDFFEQKYLHQIELKAVSNSSSTLTKIG